MKTQEMKEKELKPCPFCGGAASTPRNIAGPRSAPRWYIYCQSGEHTCLTVRTDANTEQDAIAAWNRRPASNSALYWALKEAREALEVLALDLKHNNGNRGTMANFAADAEAAASAALASATPQGEGKGE